VDHLPSFQILAKIFFGLFYKKCDQVGYNSAFAAASPLVRANPEVCKGKYIEGDYGKVVPYRKRLVTDLWAVTEAFVKSKGHY